MVTFLDNTEKRSTADLTRRLGVTLAAVPTTGQVQPAGPCAETSAGSQDPEPARVEQPEIEASEVITGEPPMQDRGQQSEAAGVPHYLTELASGVLQHLREVQTRNRELMDQLAAAMEAHRRDAMELVAAETREMATNEELERALITITNLRRELAESRRLWWTKL
jgi:hypothetical protein